MPAYFYDPYRYRAHKMKGGTFQNFNEKFYLKLTDFEIENHYLNGIQQIGVYPLLQDNTSWFLVAGFDKENWKTEVVLFLNACRDKNIPAYLERSRSVNGGHVWIFFEQPYPAIKSRRIFISILEQSGTFSLFDKSSSFDRLFPNQGFLSGKGLGNLIALPFFKSTLENGNSCFINPESFKPIADQWQFLKEVKRICVVELDKLLQQSLNSDNRAIHRQSSSGRLEISLSNKIKISRTGLTVITLLINVRLIGHSDAIFCICGGLGLMIANYVDNHKKHE